MKRTISLTTKFVVILLVIIVAIGCVLFVSSFQNIRTFEQQSQNAAESALNDLVVFMELQMNGLDTVGSVISEDEGILSYLRGDEDAPSPVKLEERLENIAGKYSSIPFNIYIISENGDYLATDKGYRYAVEDGIEKMKMSEWYQQRNVWNNRMECAGVFPAYIANTGSAYHCIFKMNIYNSLTKLQGVIVLDINSYVINRQLARVVAQGDSAFLTDRGSRIIGKSSGSPSLYNSVISDSANNVSVPFRGNEMALTYEVNRTVISTFQKNTTLSILWVVGILAGVGFISYYYIKRIFLKPVIDLSKSMKAFSETIERTELPVRSSDEIGVLTECFNQMSGDIEHAVAQIKQNEQQLSSLEFRMLQSQINPHFLYNTLNSIRVMAGVMECGNLATAISCLSGLLRYSIGERGDLVTIDDEIRYIKDYIYLNNMRFNDRFKLNVDVDKSLNDVKVLKFLIQPFVENSILHGYSNSKGAGRIDIFIAIDEDDTQRLRIIIRDYGKGFSLKELSTETPRRHGIGVVNVDERLHLLYGDRYSLKIDGQSREGTCVTLLVPYGLEEANGVQ